MPRTATLDFVSNEQPTGRLPTVTLIAEARRMDSLAEASDDERTVNIDPEENRRLLASAVALDEPPQLHAEADDAPTVIAPFPATPRQLSVERSAPPAAASCSGLHARVRPTLERAHRVDRSHAWLPKGSTETWLVVGIWATALSLMALLMLIVTSG